MEYGMEPENLETQNLPRVANELLILSSLADRKMHGYEIALDLEERSGGLVRFQYGTLYPILHRLEKAGFIKGKWVREGAKRKRKYYTLTTRGREYARSQLRAWDEFAGRFTAMTRGLRS